MRISLRFFVQSCLVLAVSLMFASSNASGQDVNPFFTPPTYPGGGQAVKVDINGDGQLDVVFFDGTILFGKSDGTFEIGLPWNRPGLNLGVAQLAVADFNGDGKPDIFLAGDPIYVLVGNGDGNFRDPVTTSVPGPVTAVISIFSSTTVVARSALQLSLFRMERLATLPRVTSTGTRSWTSS